MREYVDEAAYAEHLKREADMDESDIDFWCNEVCAAESGCVDMSVAWPTWSDGSPVRICEVAMSEMGPARIASVEVSVIGYKLRGWLLSEEGRDGDDEYEQVVIHDGSFISKSVDYPIRVDED